MKIADVDLSVTNDGFLKVDAMATTPTLGWTNVGLQPVEYVMFPGDGVLDIQLVGTAPVGAAATSIGHFPVSVVVSDKPEVRGVRISWQNERLITVLRAVKNAEDIGKAPIFLEAGSIQGDQLFLNVRYAGGCGPHSFQLGWDGAFLKSFPPQIILRLSHNPLQDECKAVQSELLQFDLSTALGETPPELMKIHVASVQNQISIDVPR
ncbi:hypothetical protein SAMN05192549_104204 [Duganella sacchari]|uniref:Uncharacterized protein n=1 Tax=Duganella sacchari TaxID=551987 RepID=A0A1M7NVC5_9BURK|nr:MULTISPECIES: hypothetical protein [Duganella]MYM27657.1 hypothetical protein [Duganella sp. CY15W]SHN07922.1 hypothetical protein SAMN05192549_104204 [Duganella sacchari]